MIEIKVNEFDMRPHQVSFSGTRVYSIKIGEEDLLKALENNTDFKRKLNKRGICCFSLDDERGDMEEAFDELGKAAQKIGNELLVTHIEELGDRITSLENRTVNTSGTFCAIRNRIQKLEVRVGKAKGRVDKLEAILGGISSTAIQAWSNATELIHKLRSQGHDV